MLANFSNLITFSRGSNATVTDASGRLTYAPHNLVTNSQDFEAAGWSKTAATVTANTAVAPDGTTTADKAVATAASGYHGVGQSVTFPNGLSILSVYAKAAEYSLFRVFDFNSGDFAASFNLTNGAVSNTGGARLSSASATAVGNGWYRCTLILNNVSAARSPAFVGYPAGATLDLYGAQYTGDGTSGVLIWGAQLEAVTYQTTPSPYVSTSVANLLGFSEAFDNAAWTKTNTAVVTAAAQNPINNLWNAQKLMATVSTATHSATQDVTINSTFPFTFSVYVKAAEYSTGAIVMTGLSSPFPEIRASFNLTNGTVTTAGSTVTASSITLIGNGWYRVSLSGYTSQSGLHRFYIHPNTNASYTGDGSSGIYIYGAQLSNSGSLDPYVPTPGAAPSSTAYYGPRYDYDPVTLAAKGILIEEARTNLLTYSQQFDNGSVWVLDNGGAVNPVVTANQGIAPDGTNTADRIILNKTGGVYSRIQQQTVLASAVYTFSVWMKTTSGTGTANVGLRIDLQAINCAVTGVWQRFSVTLPSAVANPPCQILLFDSIAGNDETADILVYGAQLEAGAFATSYIPTVASQVTRSADVASITGSLFSQWFNQDQGTLVAQVYRGDASGTTRGVWSARDVSGTTSMDYRVYAGQCLVQISGATQADLYPGAGSANAIVKNAFTYRVNDFAATTNGGVVQTDTSGAVPIVSQLNIGALSAVTGQVLCGHIQTIEYIPNAVSSSQLQWATS